MPVTFFLQLLDKYFKNVIMEGVRIMRGKNRFLHYKFVDDLLVETIQIGVALPIYSLEYGSYAGFGALHIIIHSLLPGIGYTSTLY